MLPGFCTNAGSLLNNILKEGIMGIVRRTMALSFAVIVMFALSGEVFAASITFTMNRTSDFGRVNFAPAYMLAWSGDVKYEGATVGEFNASIVKTTVTGASGYVTQYDLVIPGSGPIGDFMSIRTLHVATGNGSDQGVIFATSPDFTAFIGATVTMSGESVTITY